MNFIIFLKCHDNFNSMVIKNSLTISPQKLFQCELERGMTQYAQAVSQVLELLDRLTNESIPLN